MGNFTLKFFAKLKDDVGISELSVAVEDVNCVSSLIDYLCEVNPSWKDVLERPLLTAVNQTMVRGDAAIKAGDEVALFPPVTGG